MDIATELRRTEFVNATAANTRVLAEAEAHRIGADALVMGAYGRRRFLEILIGGATRDVLAQADMPVFLHH